jgi:non-specific serine/threonine protein kinase
MLFTLGHYNVLERIGAGGMGEVYRARDTKLGRTVAIKVLPEAIAGDKDRRDRFLREARAAAALSHPNIAMLFEVGEDASRLYLVFEHINGRTLGAAISGRPVAPRLALDLAIQIADGLADAHAAGLIHRDIKPDNIIVTPKEKAKILDFGLARWTAGGTAREMAATISTTATAPGAVLGTVAYMSPEQALGESLDPRTDIFSLGIVFYEMLTGRNPFAADAATAVLLNIAQRTPPPPSTINPDVPRELDPIVAKMLAKNPFDRYETAVALAAELRSVATMLAIRSGEAEPRVYGPVKRRRSGWRLAAGVVLLLAITGGAWWFGREAARRVWRQYVAAPPAPRIAVLPLEDRGAGDRTYFADGLTEDLISRLGQVQGLSVLGRSATRELRGVSPADAARRLDAEAVLTGSVRRESSELRVSLELVDADDGVIVWSHQYTKPIDSVFGVQAEIAGDVARALRLKLAGDVRERAGARQVNARAYDVYLQARDAAARRDVGRAVSLFEQALNIDDGLAEAHAGLAEALYLQYSYEGRRLDSRLRARVGFEAERAMAIDPDLAAGELAAGLVATDFRESLRRLRRAVTLDASYAEAYHQIGDQIAGIDPRLAIDFYDHSQALDRNIFTTYLDLAIANAALNRFDEARRHVARLREIPGPGPGVADTLADMAEAAIVMHSGQLDRAAGMMDPMLRPGVPPRAAALVLRAFAGAGRNQDALAAIDKMQLRDEPDCDVRATAGGLLADNGRRAEGLSLLAAHGDQQAWCAAVLAAARGDAERAAASLVTLAKDEAALREWTLVATGASDYFCFTRRWYPWVKVAKDPSMVEAERTLEAARIEMRNVARQALTGLLPAARSGGPGL